MPRMLSRIGGGVYGASGITRTTNSGRQRLLAPDRREDRVLCESFFSVTPLDEIERVELRRPEVLVREVWATGRLAATRRSREGFAESARLRLAAIAREVRLGARGVDTRDVFSPEDRRGAVRLERDVCDCDSLEKFLAADRPESREGTPAEARSRRTSVADREAGLIVLDARDGALADEVVFPARDFGCRTSKAAGASVLRTVSGA